jgi:hypothetical protein
MAWQVANVGDRLYSVISPVPEIGSLTFDQPFEVHLSRNISSGKTDAELAVRLLNRNARLLKFSAIIAGDVNGKTIELENGSKSITFSGYVGPGMSTSLILRFTDIPAPPPGSIGVRTTGTFFYDVSYFIAPSGRKTRRTMKHIAFDGRNSLKNTPAEGGAAINVLFLDEKEE